MAPTHSDSLGELAERMVGDARVGRVLGGGMLSVVPAGTSRLQQFGARAAIVVEPSGETR